MSDAAGWSSTGRRSFIDALVPARKGAGIWRNGPEPAYRTAIPKWCPDPIQGKGNRAREMFFSRRVSRCLDDYLKQRGEPTIGPLFITARKARSSRRADLTADGHARLSYRQADTLWKQYTPGWDLHQLRHAAISARAAQGYTEVELKRFSGHLSSRSLEVYIAHNREAAKRKARAWERHTHTAP